MRWPIKSISDARNAAVIIAALDTPAMARRLEEMDAPSPAAEYNARQWVEFCLTKGHAHKRARAAQFIRDIG